MLFQVGFGLSPFRSGLLLLASASGNLGMKALTTRILNGIGLRNLAIGNIAIAAVIITACGWLSPTCFPPVLFVLLIYGLTRSRLFNTLATLVCADVSDRLKGGASTYGSVAQQSAIGMAIAVDDVSLGSARPLAQILQVKADLS